MKYIMLIKAKSIIIPAETKQQLQNKSYKGHTTKHIKIITDINPEKKVQYP